MHEMLCGISGSKEWAAGNGEIVGGKMGVGHMRSPGMKGSRQIEGEEEKRRCCPD